MCPIDSAVVDLVREKLRSSQNIKGTYVCVYTILYVLILYI